MARSRPIDSKGKKGFKVLVLSEVDRMSREAQHSLRRTMEKYSAACRLVLCCNNASRASSSMVAHWFTCRVLSSCCASSTSDFDVQQSHGNNRKLSQFNQLNIWFCSQAILRYINHVSQQMPNLWSMQMRRGHCVRSPIALTNEAQITLRFMLCAGD